MADLDADGHIDLISGSWPGEIFLFRGGPNGFSKPEKIKGHDGKSINIGGGIRDNGEGHFLIAGDAQFEQGDDGQYLVYEGQKIKVPEGRSAGITGTASSVGVADWDGDGDFDLLVGDIQGNVWLVPNDGTPQKYAFGPEKRLQAGGENIHVDGDAGPQAADWDGDGDLDLLVGDGEGAVTLFRNDGDRRSPSLAKGQTLVPRSEMDYIDPPQQPKPGMRSKLCAADWDGDGDLDLLVGDFAYLSPPQPEFTAEQRAEHERLRKRLSEVRESYEKSIDEYVNAARNKKLSKEEREAAREEVQKLSQEMEIQAKLPVERENHGWVWFYERRNAGPNQP